MIEVIKNRPGIVGVAIVTLATVISSFFSYILQFLLGQKLTISDFGTFTALLSLIYIITLPATVFSTSLTRKVASIVPTENKNKLGWLFNLCLRFSSIVGTVLLLVLLVGGGLLMKLFNIDDPLLIIIFAVFAGICYPTVVLPAFLQGMLKYVPYSLYNVVGSFLRTALPVLLVTYGYGLRGTFIGMIVALVISFLLLFPSLLELFKDRNKYSVSQDLKDILNFSIPVALVGFSLILINNIDVLIIKAFFNKDSVGYYAGAVTLGKIILFGAGTSFIMMFPKISSLKAAGKSFKMTFLLFLGLQLSFMLPAVAAFNLFPDLVTHLFFGERFNDSIQFVPIYSVFIGIFSLVNFMSTFFLAVGKESIYKVLVVMAVLQTPLLMAFHSSIELVILINTLICIVGLVVMLAQLKSLFSEQKVRGSLI